MFQQLVQWWRHLGYNIKMFVRNAPLTLTTGLSQSAFLSALVAAQVQFQFKVRIQPSSVQMPGCGLAPPVLSSDFWEKVVLWWLVWTWHRQLSQKVFCTNHRQLRKRELTTVSYNFWSTTVVVSQNVVLRFFFRREYSRLNFKSVVYLSK